MEEGETMNRNSDLPGGPHQMRWGGGREIEEERIDEILELIWTLRERGISDLDQLLEEERILRQNRFSAS